VCRLCVVIRRCVLIRLMYVCLSDFGGHCVTSSRSPHLPKWCLVTSAAATALFRRLAKVKPRVILRHTHLYQQASFMQSHVSQPSKAVLNCVLPAARYWSCRYLLRSLQTRGARHHIRQNGCQLCSIASVRTGRAQGIIFK